MSLETPLTESLQDLVESLAPSVPSLASVYAGAARRQRRSSRIRIAVPAVLIAAAFGALSFARADDETSSLVAASVSSVFEASVPVTVTAPLGDPVSVTGLRIGDTIPAGELPPGMRSDGSFDPSLLPLWIPVVDSTSIVIGYALGGTPDPGSPDHPAGAEVIYGEGGQPIGQFIDGRAVINEP